MADSIKCDTQPATEMCGEHIKRSQVSFFEAIQTGIWSALIAGAFDFANDLLQVLQNHLLYFFCLLSPSLSHSLALPFCHSTFSVSPGFVRWKSVFIRFIHARCASMLFTLNKIFFVQVCLHELLLANSKLIFDCVHNKKAIPSNCRICCRCRRRRRHHFKWNQNKCVSRWLFRLAELSFYRVVFFELFIATRMKRMAHERWTNNENTQIIGHISHFSSFKIFNSYHATHMNMVCLSFAEFDCFCCWWLALVSPLTSMVSGECHLSLRWSIL